MAGTPPPHPSNKAEPRQLQKKKRKKGVGAKDSGRTF